MPLHDGLENMPLTTIKHLGVCWPSDDSVRKTKNRPALCMPLIPQFQRDLKVKHLYFKADACEVVAIVAAAAVVFGIVVWSWLWQQKAKKKTNVKKDLGRIWLAKLKARERKGESSPETAIGGE